MRLLFLTQRLDPTDAVLGFVPRWVAGLARRCERVRVVALDAAGDEHLPANVDVRRVGRRGRLARWMRYRRALREALGRDGFDTVLAHMVPRYALLAAGPARAAGARAFLWYTHGTVDGRLRRAERAVEAIFTATPESLRLATPKRVVTGHGIDLEHFAAGEAEPAAPPRVLVVGRITPRKGVLTAVEAVALLGERNVAAHLDLVGGPLAPGDERHVAEVRAAVERRGLGGRVTLHGAVPYSEVPRLYRRCSLVVNPSRTGSLDKVVLEGMASERPVLSCNEAAVELFAELRDEAAGLAFPAEDAAALAERLAACLARPAAERRALGARLRRIVERDHEVDALMARLVEHMRARR